MSECKSLSNEGIMTKMIRGRMTLARMIGEGMMIKWLGMRWRGTLEMMIKEGMPRSGWWDV